MEDDLRREASTQGLLDRFVGERGELSGRAGMLVGVLGLGVACAHELRNRI
jgi:hypothetical protein